MNIHLARKVTGTHGSSCRKLLFRGSTRRILGESRVKEMMTTRAQNRQLHTSSLLPCFRRSRGGKTINKATTVRANSNASTFSNSCRPALDSSVFIQRNGRMLPWTCPLSHSKGIVGMLTFTWLTSRCRQEKTPFSNFSQLKNTLHFSHFPIIPSYV